MRFEVVTRASPDQVRDALIDFSERRLAIWDRTLDPEIYELRDSGDTWAVAQEGTAGSPFWVVCRYDWSDPDVVRWEVVESSYGGGGTGSVRVDPTGDGGSRVRAAWDYTSPVRTRDKMMLFVLHHSPVGRMIARMWRTALDAHADR